MVDRESSEDIREAMQEKSDEELSELIDNLDQKIPERRPGEISTTLLLRCRKKAIASSVLEDRKEGSSATERRSAPKSKGQQGLGAF